MTSLKALEKDIWPHARFVERKAHSVICHSTLKQTTSLALSIPATFVVKLPGKKIHSPFITEDFTTTTRRNYFRTRGGVSDHKSKNHKAI